jgi:hypothetical protein
MDRDENLIPKSSRCDRTFFVVLAIINPYRCSHSSKLEAGSWIRHASSFKLRASSGAAKSYTDI